MNSVRLKEIASLVLKGESVVDVGTDHGYIPIWLVNNKITDKVLATDISSKVLEGTKKNIRKYGLEDVIELRVSDGFLKVFEDYDVGILAGMGTKTMMQILSHEHIPDTLILQSNNEIDLLRQFMNEKGYKIFLEKAIFEDRFYVIIKYVKGREKLSLEEILFGKSGNRDYLEYLLEQYKELYKKSRKKEFREKVLLLQKFIEKIPALK